MFHIWSKMMSWVFDVQRKLSNMFMYFKYIEIYVDMTLKIYLHFDFIMYLTFYSLFSANLFSLWSRILGAHLGFCMNHEPHKELCSYDVTTLFTSVPIVKVVESIRNKLEEDPTLNKRTSTYPSWLLSLLQLHCARRQVLPTDPWGGHGFPHSDDNVWCDDGGHQREGHCPSSSSPYHWWYSFVDDTQAWQTQCPEIHIPPEHTWPWHQVYHWGGRRQVGFNWH